MLCFGVEEVNEGEMARRAHGGTVLEAMGTECVCAPPNSSIRSINEVETKKSELSPHCDRRTTSRRTESPPRSLLSEIKATLKPSIDVYRKEG